MANRAYGLGFSCGPKVKETKGVFTKDTVSDDPRIAIIKTLLAKRKFTRVRREAMKLGGDDPHFLSSVALILAMAGQSSSSLHLLSEARRMAPNDPDILLRHGAVQERLGKGQEALNSYKEASGLAPKLVGPHLAIAQYHARKGNITGAREEFEIVLELDPRSEPALLAMGTMYAKEGNAREAENLLLKGAKHHSKNPAFFLNLFVLYRELGADRKAGKMKKKLEKLGVTVREGAE